LLIQREGQIFEGLGGYEDVAAQFRRAPIARSQDFGTLSSPSGLAGFTNYVIHASKRLRYPRGRLKLCTHIQSARKANPSYEAYDASKIWMVAGLSDPTGMLEK